MSSITNSGPMGTKAETLLYLSKLGYKVPKTYHFTVKEWQNAETKIIHNIITIFDNINTVAVRSSTLTEDTGMSSMAGVFESCLNVITNKDALKESINKVISSFDASIENQVLIQTMLIDVVMSGVVMTKVLDDGSPYYVINYDDTTGKTDSITSGNSINKTVYIYNGVKDDDFDSVLLLRILKLVRSLEETFYNVPIDIEFAINNDKQIELLQVRRIATVSSWDKEIHNKISARIDYLKIFVQTLMKKRIDIYGDRTLFGIMPDWNPAEMIGVVPRPLAASLYRELITKRIWSRAREMMGYRRMPNIDLMVSLFGRPYIDVRNSFNSFLPENLDGIIAEKITNEYLNILDNDPHLHDKIEFEIVLTCYDFTIDQKFQTLYKGILNDEDEKTYKDLLKSLTIEAIKGTQRNSLNKSLGLIENLKELQVNTRCIQDTEIMFVIDEIKTLIEECKKYGTLPFSVIARHAFIAEALLRSLTLRGAIEKDRVFTFKKSFMTVAGQMSKDLYKMKTGEISEHDFRCDYGHLRPSSYDILSPRYADRSNIYDGKNVEPSKLQKFNLTERETSAIQEILDEHNFIGVTPADIFDYAKMAIKGREYAKFIFTKHLSNILELISYWGKHFNLSRDKLSMLSLSDVLEMPYEPLHSKYEEYFLKKKSNCKKRI